MPVRFHRSGVAFDPIYVLNGITPHIHIIKSSRGNRRLSLFCCFLPLLLVFHNCELYLLQCCITALYCLVWFEVMVNAMCSVEQCQFEGSKRGLVHVEGNFDVLRWTGFCYNYVTPMYCI